MKFQETYSLDDILLVPQYSDIESRKEVDLTSTLDEKLDIRSPIPIIASPMDTITEGRMASRMFELGGLAIVHRYNTIIRQVQIIEDVGNYYGQPNAIVAAAVGVTGDYLERAIAIQSAGARIICIDISHGNCKLMERAIKSIRDSVIGDKIHLMAGNIATASAFEDLERWGADSIRVGIGGGSICSTRVQTGHGVPNASSLMDCVSVAEKAKVILDGGLKTAGDIVKAYALGADFVMVGSLLAGTDECPGEILDIRGQKCKRYSGMASYDSQKNNKKPYSIEGVSTTVPCKGPVSEVLRNLEENIKSGLSYSGARNIKELRAKAKFVKQTSLGFGESSPHILFNK